MAYEVDGVKSTVRSEIIWAGSCWVWVCLMHWIGGI